MALSPALVSHVRQDWRTPLALYRYLDARYAFDLDVAADADNAMCEQFYTPAQDGLGQPWEGRRVWCNPPYGRDVWRWCAKAAESDALTVMLLPSRTDTQWFHTYVLPHSTRITFLQGRLTFEGAPAPAPFPSVLVEYDPEQTGQMLQYLTAREWRHFEDH